MRTITRISLVLAGASMLAGCGSNGVLGRSRPDEFAVQRQAPLAVPPDFALVPPKPGAPRPAEGTAAQQALEALFGGPAPRSQSETSLLENAGRDRAMLGARSAAGDPETRVVDKGNDTQTIINAPETNTQDATAQPPQ
jgi:hypothetical protein